MLTAFAYRPQESLKKLESIEEIDAVWRDPEVRLWVDIEKPTAEILRHLDGIVDVDDTSLEACLASEEARPRVDEFSDHIFLLLYGVLTPDEDPEFEPRKLAAFCGNRFLITIHDDRHRTIENLKARFASHGQHIMARGVDFLLYSIIDGMVDNYGIALATFDRQLEELEEESLGNQGEAVLAKAALLRRELLELRRLAFGQRDALGSLARGECDYVASTLGRRFSHVANHLTKIIEHSDSLREVLGGVRENYQFYLARKTNEIMSTLTIFASMLLPMSLIAGIYGMNLQTYPSLEDPYGFWKVIAAMATLSIAMLLYFRSRKWW